VAAIGIELISCFSLLILKMGLPCAYQRTMLMARISDECDRPFWDSDRRFRLFARSNRRVAGHFQGRAW
jgi:hypothetical protein